MSDDVTPAVRRFIARNFLFRDEAALADDASLLEASIMDSTAILELICFLETTFDIAVDDGEIVPENMDSIRAIGEYVRRKRVACRADVAA